MSVEASIAIETKKVLWNTAITKAKGLVEMMRKSQLDIAKIAYEICTPWGAGNSEFSYTNFAEAVNVHPKTLTDWIAIYRTVVLNTPSLKNKEVYTGEDYRSARRAVQEQRYQSKLKEYKTPEARAKAKKKRIAGIASIHSRIIRHKSNSTLGGYSSVFLRSLNIMCLRVEKFPMSQIPSGTKKETIIKLRKLLKRLEA